MNAQPNPAFQSPAALPAVTAIRPMYWSIRREVWENRSIYIAPPAAAAVVICGWMISLFGLPRSVREVAALGPPHQSAALAQPYSHAAFLIVLTGFIVGIFYSLDALYGERRDRSILFWKSLPISDWMTVLSKAIIPLAVLPLISFVLIVIVDWIMLPLSSAVLLLSGGGAATLLGSPALVSAAGRSLDKSTLLIVGATGDLGSGCARCLAPCVRRVQLCARNLERLRRLAAEL
jgi:ABC-2 type transport system permease protein